MISPSFVTASKIVAQSLCSGEALLIRKIFSEILNFQMESSTYNETLITISFKSFFVISCKGTVRALSEADWGVKEEFNNGNRF